MTQRRSTPETVRLFGLIAGVVVVATMYFAQAVLVPFALAMLLSFLLTPLVRLLEKLRLPRVPAVLLVVILAMGAAISVGIVVADQLVDVTSQLPTYRVNIQKKLAFLHDGGRTSVVRATEAVSELGKEIVQALPGAAPAMRQRSGRITTELKPGEPIEVQVVKPPVSAWESFSAVLTPIGVAGVVLVFTVFILLRLEDLRNRFIRLVGHNHITLMTQALDDASRRIGKYLLLQLIVNGLYGVVVGGALHFIGLPNALLWGVIAAVLRFVPYIGPPVAAMLPIALSLAVFDGWTRSLAILGLFLVIEIVVGNFIEPMLYGANTGISSLAILVAAVFWTLLWGPIGLVLSTPLTVCLVVIGRHVPQLKFLHVLLGDEPVLTPEMHFYQRMLASDLGEARQVLDQNLKGKRLQELYDSVVIPALGTAQRDRFQNDLDETAADNLVQNTRDLVEELNEEYAEPEGAKPASSVDLGRVPARTIHVVCVPTRSSADETIGVMLVQLLERKGEQAQCVAIGHTAETIDQLVHDNPDVVVVSALQPFALTHARKLYAQIRTRLSATPILIGLWNFNGPIESVAARFGPGMTEMIVTNLAIAVEKIRTLTIERPIQDEAEVVASH